MDCLRWYSKEDPTKVLYEEWFRCEDLGSQIAVAINRFKQTKHYLEQQPMENMQEPCFPIDVETEVMQPLPLSHFIENNLQYESSTKETKFFIRRENADSTPISNSGEVRSSSISLMRK